MRFLTHVVRVVAFTICCRNASSFAPHSAPLMTSLYSQRLTCQGTKLWAETSVPPAENNDNHDENLSSTDDDPLIEEIIKWKDMDINALINNGLLLVIAVAVVWKVTTVNNVQMMRGWTASEMAWRVPIDNWASYSSTLSDAPIATKAVTSATVYAIGDLIAQTTEGAETRDIDRLRTLRSMTAGLIGHGPMSHYWYDVSEGLFTNVLHWTDWWSFFPKVILDQTTWGPFWNNSYILLLGLMKRESLTSIWSDVKRTTVPLVISGLKLWPLAHCVTYGLIPVENRLLWVDIVEILWVTILATQANGDGDAHGGGTCIEESSKDILAISNTTTVSALDPAPSR